MSKATTEEPPSRRWLQHLVSMFCFRPRNSQGLMSILKRASDDEVLDRALLTMIEGVLCVGDMRVREIMIPRSQMKVIRKDATDRQILKMVTDGSHSRFPVVDDTPDKISGILHAKDLLRFFEKDEKQPFDINEYLRPSVIVPESKRLKVLLEEFRKNRNHMAIVVDEYGGVSGLITIEDVLEQIVGDITDEYDDIEDNYVFAHKSGDFRVKALMPLEDFNQQFKVNLSNGSSDTIGGFIVNTLRHLPERGEKIEINQLMFEVVHADNRRIHSLLVKKKA